MEDRISNLPADIIDDILSNLPLRDAARTSLLSRQWRYKLTTLPHLVFDEESVLGASHKSFFISETLGNIIDHVLLLHSGPIHKFKLSFRYIPTISQRQKTLVRKIDLWIRFLSRAGSLKEFVLEIDDYDDDDDYVYLSSFYDLPYCFYSCLNLIRLKLCKCVLTTPSTFTGFRSLKTLHLQCIWMFGRQEFEFLVTNCPLLEDLTLIKFRGFPHLNINAPNLLYLKINGSFKEINLENTFQLAEVFIALNNNNDDDDDDDDNNNDDGDDHDDDDNDSGYGQDIAHFGRCNMMVKFLALLPSLQKLKVGNCFLKYLASGGKVPKRLPNPCIVLRYLSLHVNFEDKRECDAALCLLTSSPNLGKLVIRARRQPNEEHETGGAMLPNYLKELEDKNISQDCCEFTNLRLITIHILGCAREVNFIEFLLLNSPVLERMTIKPPNDIIGFKLLKEMINFHRASVLAEIVFVDSKN